MSKKFAIRVTDWRRDADALRFIRRTVFVVEQRVPEALEWDDVDAASVHALAQDASGNAHDIALAYARVLTDPSSVMRRVVREPWRRLRLFWWRIWS